MSNTYQVAIEAKSGTGKCSGATVIRRRHATRDDRIGAAFQCIGQEELELAHLVASQRRASVVVALDEELDVGAVLVEGVKEPGLDVGHSGDELNRVLLSF